jgi:hypothetical protein
MTLQEVVIQNIIRRLLRGDDYRTEILALINVEFLSNFAAKMDTDDFSIFCKNSVSPVAILREI